MVFANYCKRPFHSSFLHFHSPFLSPSIPFMGLPERSEESLNARSAIWKRCFASLMSFLELPIGQETKKAGSTEVKPAIFIAIVRTITCQRACRGELQERQCHRE